MRYLALDVGDERIGLAISDELGLLARPLAVIGRVSGSASFRRIAALVAEERIEGIVVGLPLLESGDEGKQVASTRAYVAGLVRYVDLPIIYVDERYSTHDAQEIMIGNRRRRPRRRASLDAVAAAVILQRYLDDAMQAHREGE